MISKHSRSAEGREGGFTLVELAVVVVVVGVLTALGVPRFIRSVERTRAAEAFEYLASVRSAQERYQARHGSYAARVADLGLRSTPPRDFAVPGGFAVGESGSLRDSWSLSLTRLGRSFGYGPYTVTFGEAGYDPGGSTIARGKAAAEISPVAR